LELYVGLNPSFPFAFVQDNFDLFMIGDRFITADLLTPSLDDSEAPSLASKFAAVFSKHYWTPPLTAKRRSAVLLLVKSKRNGMPAAKMTTLPAM